MFSDYRKQPLLTQSGSSGPQSSDVRLATCKQYPAEKIRIVLDGLRGEETIAVGYFSK